MHPSIQNYQNAHLTTAHQTFACIQSSGLWIAYMCLVILALPTSSASSLNTPPPYLPLISSCGVPVSTPTVPGGLCVNR